jgi:hypothetical protein
MYHGGFYYMFYKNKNIRSCYSVYFVVFIVGTVLTAFNLLMAIGGLISVMKSFGIVQEIDTVLQASGNLAGKNVYFDITEVPQFLDDAHKKSDYYLLTDGKEYLVGEIDEDDYGKIKSAVEASGTYRIKGMTHYIADYKSKKEIALKAGQLIGQSLTEDTMDDVLGEVCIEYMELNFWNEYKNSFGLVGMIFGPIALFIFLGALSEMKASRKVISLSNITAKDIDKEACKEGSVWLDVLKVYLTENMVIGIRYEGDSDYDGHVALKYGEIQRIYSYYKAAKDNPQKLERYIVEAVATDGKKYIISGSKYSLYSDFLVGETEELYNRIKEKNQGVIHEPEGVKYQTHSFAYILEDENGNEDRTQKLSESSKEDIIMLFDSENLKSQFIPVDAIVSMKMSFSEGGVAEITTGYFKERADEVEKSLYDFLKEHLVAYNGDKDEDNEDYDEDSYYNRYYEYGIAFKELDSL